MRNAAATLLAAPLGLLGACQPATTAPKSTTFAAPSAPVQTVVQPAASAPWFENDPAGAFATARERKQLLFADLWAPWCHT